MPRELKDLNFVKVKKITEEKGYFETEFSQDEKARILAIRMENDILEDAYLLNAVLEIINSDGSHKAYAVHGINTLVGCFSGGNYFSDKEEALQYYNNEL